MASTSLAAFIHPVARAPLHRLHRVSWRTVIAGCAASAFALMAGGQAYADCTASNASVTDCSATSIVVVPNTGSSSLTVDGVNTVGLYYGPPNGALTGTFTETLNLTGSTTISNPAGQNYVNGGAGISMVAVTNLVGPNVFLNASATIGSGVTIDSRAEYGGAVFVRSENGGNLSITNAGTITALGVDGSNVPLSDAAVLGGSAVDGLNAVTNLGSSTIVNSGSVTAYSGRGLYAEGNGAAVTLDGDSNILSVNAPPVTVSVDNTASGNVGAYLAGIRVINYYGLAQASNEGVVHSSERQALVAWSAAGDSSVANSGTATTDDLNAIVAGTERGNATIVNSGVATAGKLSSGSLGAAAGYAGLRAYADYTGDISVTNTATGAVTANYDAAIVAQTPQGNVTVVNQGTATGLNGVFIDNGSGLGSVDTVADTSATSDAPVAGTARLVNSGTITAVNYGAYLNGTTNVLTNSGTISASGTAVLVGPGGTGMITNTGAISGGVGIVGSGLTIVNSGAISGGTDAITFTGGANTLTLQGTSWSLTGTIGINGGGSVTFNQATDQTLANAITGDGSVIQNGIGTLTLSGANTYTGPTEVAAGRLAVTGSITSNVTVDSGASFGGTGTVTGNVTNNGFVRPGMGTLGIAGTYTNNAGGTYQVELTPSGQSDRIAVTGNGVLNGGTVALLIDSGSYTRNTTYTILTATTGVTGAFSGVTNNTFAFLTPTLSYDANNVFLTLLQGSNAFANGARTGNQHGVGAVLDRANANAGGDFGAVLNALSTLDTQQGPKALDAISGQPIANFGTANTLTIAAFMSAIGAHMGTLHGGFGGGTHVAMAAPSSEDACTVACDVTQPSNYGAWISGVGGLGSALGNGNAGALTYNFGGTAVGMDYRLRPDLLVGIGAGYVTGTQWTSGFDGRSTSDSFSGGIYASYTPGAFYVDGLVGYAYAINKVTRTIAISGLQPRIATGTTGANQFLGQIETGYKLDLPVPATAAITPFFRLAGSTTTQNGFSETGAQSLDLTVQQQTTNSLRTTVGADLSAEIRKVAVDIRLGWQHENADTSRPMAASFAGAPGQTFTVFGATPQHDSAVLGLAASAHVADATELYARYDGEVGGGTDNHAFTAGLRMTW